MWILIFQRMTIEFFVDIFVFPIWWYTAGARRSLLFCVHFFQSGNIQVAPGLWLKNIFVPMYGQYDWQGRIMSFFMRLVNVIGRSIALVIWLVIAILLFFVWLLIPAALVFLFIRSFIPSL